jgi:hypothetical protein
VENVQNAIINKYCIFAMVNEIIGSLVVHQAVCSSVEIIELTENF